jgi:hypothetical protein
VNLTFAAGRYGIVRGTTDSDLELFTIAPSTARGDSAVILGIDLPGVGRKLRVEAPEGAEPYGREAERLAMHKAAQILANWARGNLGVDLSVNVIDNT